MSIVSRCGLVMFGLLRMVDETLSITDRAYMLFEGKIMFQGTSEELADNPIVREKYLGRDFKLKVKTRVDTVVNPNIEGFI